jgi:hypothetical protein
MGILNSLVPPSKDCETAESGPKLKACMAIVKLEKKHRKNGLCDRILRTHCNINDTDHFHDIYFINYSLTPTSVKVKRFSENDCIEFDESRKSQHCVRPTDPLFNNPRNDQITVPAKKRTRGFFWNQEEPGETHHCVNIRVCDESENNEKVIAEIDYHLLKPWTIVGEVEASI